MTDVVQAEDDTLWFVMDGQVCRFTGKHVSCPQPTLRVQHILAVPTGGLIVASEAPVTFASLTSDGLAVSPLKANTGINGPIKALCWWQGLPWVAHGRNLLPLLARDVAAHPAINLPSEIAAFATRGAGALIVATQTAVLSLEHSTSKPLPIHSPDLDGHNINALSLDAEGQLWVATTKGIWHHGHIVPQNSQVEGSFHSRPAHSVLIDHEGSAWVGSEAGLIQLRLADPVRVFASAEGLGGEMPFSVLALHDDDVWLTDNAGVSHWDGRGFRRFSIAAGFKFIDLRTLAVDPKGGMWFGGIGSGLWWLGEGKAHAVTLPSSGASPGIHSLLTTADDSLWIGFEDGGLAVRSPSGVVTTIVTHSAATPNQVGPMVEHGNAVWVGFRDGGVAKVRREVFEWVVPPTGSLLAHKQVTSLAFDPQSASVWIGTLNHGLFRHQDGQIDSLTTAQGLPSNRIHSLSVDSRNRLWAGCDRGVFAVDLTQAASAMLTHQPLQQTFLFDVQDGMRANETVKSFVPAAALTLTGKLWQPTTNGVAVFDTKRLPRETSLTSLRLEAFAVNGKVLEPNVASAPVGAGIVEAHVFAPTFLNPHRMQIRYRLQSAALEPASPWLVAHSDGHLTFMGLQSGSYLLQAQAFWRDQAARAVETSRAFTLSPPFYRSSLFASALAVLFAASVAALYRGRSRRLRQRFEVVLAERRRIARDMHDSLQQDLVGLRFHLEAALLTDEVKHSMRLHLEKAAELANEGIRDLRDAITGLAAASLTVAGLEQKLTLLTTRMFSGSATTCVIRREGLASKVSIHAASALLQIAKEAVTNIYKHANATSVEITLLSERNSLILRIRDNGQGFAAASPPIESTHGIANMKLRAREAKLAFSLVSNPGQGCMIELTAPLSNEDT